ncbi:MAG: FAD-dependent oxidoreductase [Pseudomonadota bacterium]
MSAIVIIGTGLAGYTAAREFRKLDSSTPLHLISRDAGSFYSKPILSNALALKKTPALIALNTAADMERQLAATVSPHSPVSAIDPTAHHITVNGEAIAYAKLVLAVGADPIRLPLAGDAADGVMSVNDLSDYQRFRDALDDKRRVVILGAGLIGCEFANDLRLGGYDVNVVDLAPQLLGRLLPPLAAGFLRATLEAAGVRFSLGTSVQSVTRAAPGIIATLVDGTVIEADLVLSAIGLRPRIDLARDTGLTVNRGIVTDAFLQSSAKDVYALGDCAEVAGFNLPFVMPIMQAARALAKTLHGTPTPVSYPAMPVVVKTPACPTVVCPPPPGVEGNWEESVAADGVRALFHDSAGTLRGFALVGAATKDKQALTKDVPPLLG